MPHLSRICEKAVNFPLFFIFTLWTRPMFSASSWSLYFRHCTLWDGWGVTQCDPRDTSALLTCFHHHDVSWLFTVVTMDLLMNGLSVSAQGVGHTEGEDQRNLSPVMAPHRNVHLETIFLIIVQCCVFLAFVLCPIQVPPEIVNGAFLHWRKVLKYNPSSWRSLSSPKFKIQRCLHNGHHFICLSFLQMRIQKPKHGMWVTPIHFANASQKQA